MEHAGPVSDTTIVFQMGSGTGAGALENARRLGPSATFPAIVTCVISSEPSA
jgi:hypothetical protein